MPEEEERFPFRVPIFVRRLKGSRSDGIIILPTP